MEKEVVRILTVKTECKACQRPRATIRGKHARVYQPKVTLDFENLIAYEYMQKYIDAPMFRNAVELNCVFFFGLNVGDFTKGGKIRKRGLQKLNGEIKECTNKDIDNLLKSIMDALTKGQAWLDDKLVVKVVAEKKWSLESKIEITIKGEIDDDK